MNLRAMKAQIGRARKASVNKRVMTKSEMRELLLLDSEISRAFFEYSRRVKELVQRTMP
jgi:hypothetical protein